MKQKKHHLLLIEPDNQLSYSYTKELSKKYIVTQCLTAEQAMNVLATHKPDIIVLEISLPKHNGIDILYDLQSYTESQDIPVALLSFMSKEELGMSEEQLSVLFVKAHFYKPAMTPRRILQEIQSLKLVIHE